MAQPNEYKIKLLVLWDILCRYTDEAPYAHGRNHRKARRKRYQRFKKSFGGGYCPSEQIRL